MNIKNIAVISIVFSAVLILAYAGINPKIALASNTSCDVCSSGPTGSILMNYDSNGDEDPDCAFLPDNGSCVPMGDGIISSHNGSNYNQLNFCVNSAVKYASGLSDISGLQVSYADVAKEPAGCLSVKDSDESNGTYRTLRVSFAPKPTSCLVVSCTASPNTIFTGQTATFVARATGGTDPYTYSWSGACSGSGLNCSNTYNTSGTKTSNVTVTSGNQTDSANCSVSVSQLPPPNLNVFCSANPSSIQTGQATTFTAYPSGGTGSYTYSWSGACSGTGLNCNNTFSTSGTKTATVNVTSGNQTDSASCSVSVNRACTPEYEQRCVGTSLYWYNSCGVRGSYIGTCGTICTPNYEQRCVGNSKYWYDSCGNQGSYIGTCGNIGTLTLTKTVRNLTGYPSGPTGFASSTYASPSDTLMFLITLQNTGSQDVSNVVVRDSLPTNLIYNNQLVVARSNNVSGNYSGDIAYGINLNTIPVSQTVTISYQAQVASAANFSFGTTTLNNSVYVTSSANNYTPNAVASVFVTRAAVLGATTISTGLTNNLWADSFLLPLLITLAAIWMWKSGIFFGAEKWFLNKKKARQEYVSEKELANRLAELRKLGS